MAYPIFVNWGSKGFGSLSIPNLNLLGLHIVDVGDSFAQFFQRSSSFIFLILNASTAVNHVTGVRPVAGVAAVVAVFANFTPPRRFARKGGI